MLNFFLLENMIETIWRKSGQVNGKSNVIVKICQEIVIYLRAMIFFFFPIIMEYEFIHRGCGKMATSGQNWYELSLLNAQKWTLREDISFTSGWALPPPPLPVQVT